MRQELLDSLSTDNVPTSRNQVSGASAKKKVRRNQPKPVSGASVPSPQSVAEKATISLAEASKKLEETLSYAAARMTTLREEAEHAQPGSLSYLAWRLDDAISCLRTVAKQLRNDHPDKARQLELRADEFARQGDTLKKVLTTKRFLHMPSKESLRLAQPCLSDVRFVFRDTMLTARPGRDRQETLTELAFTVAEAVTVPGPDGNPIQESEAVLHIHRIPGRHDPIAHFKRGHERAAAGEVWRRTVDTADVSRFERAAKKRSPAMV